jgi:glycosyltransferase involved in cell wall biosynthesis
MAEAMLLGKPVIATRYSGNLDFMTDENSILVDCQVRPISKRVPPYDIPNARWAEPDLEEAARAMRRVFDDGEFREKLARQASKDAARMLSLENAGGRFSDRLRAIESIMSQSGKPRSNTI